MTNKNTDLTKEQIAHILYDFNHWVSYFEDLGVSDYEYLGDNVKVFVQFGLCLREVDILKIEILNSHFEIIYSKNALELRQAIEDIIKECNKSINDSINQESQENIDVLRVRAIKI